MDESINESTDQREQVGRAMKAFIESKLGRPGKIYSEFGININDSNAAQIVIDLIKEKIKSIPLDELSKMFDFLSDFDKSVGGTLDGLFVQTGIIIELRRRLVERLLYEQETSHAFDRL